jgi:hypothetical protein
MNEPDSISLESLAQLHELLGMANVYVVWFVHCEIGPSWIGGGREIQLVHNGKRISGGFSDDLISAIIVALSIPEGSSDSVITGEGEISLRNQKLLMEYEWNDTVPYDECRNSGKGEVELLLD